MNNDNFKERIEALKRLKLFTNNADEWCSKYKKYNDQYDILYKSLYYDLYDGYGINLNLLFNHYQQSDSKANGVYYKNKRRRICNNGYLIRYIKDCLTDNYCSNRFPKPDRDVLDDFYRYSTDTLFLALLLLWSLDLIFSYRQSGNDIANDNAELTVHKNKVTDLLCNLRYLYEGINPMYLEMESKMLMNKLDSNNYKRIDLINSVYNVLNNVSINLNRSHHGEIIDELDPYYYDFLEDYCWIYGDWEKEKKIIVFESHTSGYFVYMYDCNNHIYVRYEMMAFRESENISMINESSDKLTFIIPQFIEQLCLNESAKENQLVNYVVSDIRHDKIRSMKKHNGDTTKIEYDISIELSRISGNIYSLSKKINLKNLTRADVEGKFKPILDNLDSYRDKYPQYSAFKDVPFQISKEHILINYNIEDKLVWIKIAREESLSAINIEDNLIGITLNETKYLGFTKIKLYYDLSRISGSMMYNPLTDKYDIEICEEI